MNVLELDQADGVSVRAESVDRITGILTATLVGLKDDGRTPLLTYAGQPGTAALAARTTVDLDGRQIGGQVVVMFDGGDPSRPIVIGRVRGAGDSGNRPEPVPIDVEADGERMIVTAREQLVLSCGKASITLTRAGKVLISGTYLLSHSSGANRIKGGSVQLN